MLRQGPCKAVLVITDRTMSLFLLSALLTPPVVAYEYYYVEGIVEILHTGILGSMNYRDEEN